MFGITRWAQGVRSRISGVSPSGSKDPNNRVLGPNYYNMNGIWDLNPKRKLPDYLGPWTLGSAWGRWIGGLGIIVRHQVPRGSTYTAIRELGPIIPSIVWYFGA